MANKVIAKIKGCSFLKHSVEYLPLVRWKYDRSYNNTNSDFILTRVVEQIKTINFCTKFGEFKISVITIRLLTNNAYFYYDVLTVLNE